MKMILKSQNELCTQFTCITNKRKIKCVCVSVYVCVHKFAYFQLEFSVSFLTCVHVCLLGFVLPGGFTVSLCVGRTGETLCLSQ